MHEGNAKLVHNFSLKTLSDETAWEMGDENIRMELK
jgi:hypothetical protein